MPPETVKIAAGKSKLPVSGDTKSDILMPPETGKI